MAYLEVRAGARVLAKNTHPGAAGGWVPVPLLRMFFHVQVYDRPFEGGDNDILLLERYEHTDFKEGSTRWW